MPLAAHMAVTFLKMSREVAKRGKTKVWCGQNADSLYNLGPTEKTLGGPIKRFYLSKEYWKSFPDIKEKLEAELITVFPGVEELHNEMVNKIGQLCR